MPTREHLSENAQALSDDELIERLRSKNLTKLAEEVTRRELASRGVAVQRALSSSPDDSSSVTSPLAIERATMRTRLRRIARFPLRAVLGIEPLWAVVVFGGAMVFIIWKLVSLGIGHLFAAYLTVYPRSPYIVPAGYMSLGVLALALAWWAVALWRTGGRANHVAWLILARIGAVICVFAATFGIVGGLRVMQEFFAR